MGQPDHIPHASQRSVRQGRHKIAPNTGMVKRDDQTGRNMGIRGRGGQGQDGFGRSGASRAVREQGSRRLATTRLPAWCERPARYAPRAIPDLQARFRTGGTVVDGIGEFGSGVEPWPGTPGYERCRAPPVPRGTGRPVPPRRPLWKNGAPRVSRPQRVLDVLPGPTGHDTERQVSCVFPANAIRPDRPGHP